MRRRWAWAYRRDVLLFPLLAAAFMIRAYNLHLPGPYGDEMTFVFPAYQMRWGETIRGDVETVRILGTRMPVMFNEWSGSLPIYAQFLFSYFLSGRWFDYRVLDVLYALAAIALTYFFTRDFLGRREAIIAALLLSFMPSFVFYSRVGEPWHIMRMAFSSALLFFFYRWWRTSDWRYFYGGCLSVGLGLSDRLETVWWVAAVPLSTLLVDRGVLSRAFARMREDPFRVLIGFGWGLLGAGPFLVFNRQPFRWGTLVFAKKNLLTTFYGQHNTAFLQNLGVRLKHLIELLNGSDGSAFGVGAQMSANSLYPLIFFVSFAGLSSYVLVRRIARHPDRPSEFLLVAMALIFLMSTVTVSGLTPYHLLMMLPLPILIMARAVCLLQTRTVVWVIIIAMVGSDLWVDAHYYRALAQTEGIGQFSSGIFDLVRYLDDERVSRVNTCDWRLLQLIRYASRNRINGEEIFVPEPSGGVSSVYREAPPLFFQKLDESLRTPSNVYLFYAPRYEVYQRREAFLAYLRSRQLSYELKILYDRNGPLYYVYRVGNT